MNPSPAAIQSIPPGDVAGRMAEDITRGKRVGRGVLLFAIYRSEAVRAQAETALVTQLGEAIHVARVYFSKSGDKDWILTLAQNPPQEKDVYFLYQLEKAFPKALDALNYRRELLVEMKVSAVFWVTDGELAALAEKAPDFFRFHSEIFEILDLPAAGEQQHFLSELTQDAHVRELRAHADEIPPQIILRQRLLTELGDESESRSSRAGLLFNLGQLHEAAYQYPEAVDDYAAAAGLFREIGDLNGLQVSLGNQALILQVRGDLDGAMALHKEEERICRQLGNPEGLATSLANQASILKEQEKPDEALALARQAYDLAAHYGFAPLVKQIQRVIDSFSA